MTYYTKDKFNQFLKTQANRMLAMNDKALDCLIEANNYYWIHQTKWMNEPCLQLPQDLLAIQEIIYKTNAYYVIETGTGWGGLALYCHSLTKLWDGHVISIDINMPKDLVKRIKDKSDHQITLIEGSSIDPETIELIKPIVHTYNTMVILDSSHTHEHVLQELELYSSFIKPGQYIVVCDTIIEDIPDNKVERKRSWSVGNNPKTALREFMLKHPDEFVLDYSLQNKLLFSCNSYIYRTK